MTTALTILASLAVIVLIATLARRYFDRQKAKRDESMRQLAKQQLEQKESSSDAGANQ